MQDKYVLPKIKCCKEGKAVKGSLQRLSFVHFESKTKTKLKTKMEGRRGRVVIFLIYSPPHLLDRKRPTNASTQSSVAPSLPPFLFLSAFFSFKHILFFSIQIFNLGDCNMEEWSFFSFLGFPVSLLDHKED